MRTDRLHLAWFACVVAIGVGHPGTMTGGLSRRVKVQTELDIWLVSGSV